MINKKDPVRLDGKKIADTIQILKIRIEERFPSSGLGFTCGNLLAVARKSNETITLIKKVNYGYRLLVAAFVIAVLTLAGIGVTHVRPHEGIMTLSDLVTILEAAFNIILLSGGAVVFLVSIENRSKRKKVIKAINTLRSLAHIIDAHQLTKDPCYADTPANRIRTSHSPERNFDSFQLGRYLDYCSEMLSLISQVGFLYVQDYHDPIAVESVNDLENLANGMSRKIWQKIMNIETRSKTSVSEGLIQK